MGHAVLAAEHAAGTMARAIAGGIATRRLFRLQHQVERDTEAAAKFSVAARVFPEFMLTKMQGKTHFRDLKTAEL